MKLCFTCQTLDADFRMWNIKFSIIHIYKSGEKYFQLKIQNSLHIISEGMDTKYSAENVEIFTLELWKSGCRFFDRKLKKKSVTYPNMVIWNMEVFHICNLKTFVKSFLHEILNTIYLTFGKLVLIFLQEI